MEITLLSIICVLLTIHVIRHFPTKTVKSQTEFSKYISNADVTTVLATPWNANMCDHRWSVLVHDILETDLIKKSIIVAACDKCGILDKTTTYADQACQHEWERKTSVKLPSGFQQMMEPLEDLPKQIGNFVTGPSGNFNMQMFRTTHLSERVCKLCGEIKVIKISNIDEKVTGECYGKQR